VPGELFASSNADLDTVKTIVTIAVAAGAVGVGNKFLKPYVRVPKGHEAIRVRGGNPSTYKWGSRKGMVKVMPHGPHFSIPFSHDIELVDTRDRSTTLPTVKVDRPESSQFNIDAAVIWKVLSSEVQQRHWARPWRRQFRSNQANDYPARYQFQGQDIESIVQNVSGDGLRQAVTDAPDLQFRDSDYLSSIVKTRCNETLARYGVTILGVFMPEVSEGAQDRLGSYLIRMGDDHQPPSTVGAIAALGEGLRLVTDDDHSPA